jgi:enoyl-CoA hydratase/carnithine racemase
MGAAQPVLTTIEGAGETCVAHIVLNRPQARNAITVALPRDWAMPCERRPPRPGSSSSAVRAASSARGAISMRYPGCGRAQAGQWGLVYTSAPAADFERAVADLVANLLSKDAAALARAKQLVREGLRLPLRDGLALETETIIGHLGGERAGAGISRFAERGPASGGVPVSEEST